jgi:integrase
MARLEGIHRQKSKLADGSVRQYHYAWRGGPCLWKSDSDIREGSDAYVAALDKARRRTRGGGLMTPDMVDQFFDSAEFLKLDARTQADYRIWGGRLAEEFREDQATLFTYDEARGELLRWRDKWGHSPKMADMAIVTAVRILNWAGPKGRALIGRHTCEGIPRLYQGGNRAEIIWRPEDIANFEAGAPGWVVRALTTLVETGLRPGDAHRLSRNHIKATPEGRRIQIRTNKGRKKNRFASIPVTPAMARVIDETPSDRLMILVRADGGPLTQRGMASAISYWRDTLGLPAELRPYDCRGTAISKLLMANGSLKHLSSTFGWSIRYAHQVIENYVALVPEVADEVGRLLAAQNGR